MKGQKVGLPILLAAVLAALVVAGTAGWSLRAVTEGAPEEAAPSSVDVGFAQDMSVHHEQGVLMAQVAARQCTGVVRALAGGIVQAQSQEVGTMRGWLVLWREPQLASAAPMGWMDGHHHGSTMPGMATTKQLEDLQSSTGRACDRRFLTLMTAHHEGALEMAGEAARRAGTSDVRQLGRRIAREQAQEIVELRGLQQTLG
ncbi:hypothetical protein ASD11_16600 [Aeromicrobium sp. Root495]|uniref:DUF305 domain-containing protein n=1 Tax=Aeromicrobium sp. Root495 TaxID=1736550 RepID=UPI0006F37A68|nr:DUF305 domain-containing protein [Aeromicrobium sp. Root495]KQY56084.1 hypothetical protein ASD11_16600 [Aeromicrobium sp. Root495]